MPIEYKIDILKELKAKGYPTTRLRKDKILGEATIQRLRHNKSVSFEVLSKLCDLLECNIGDIITNEKGTNGDQGLLFQLSEFRTVEFCNNLRPQ